jgi:hypothetical protein
MLRVGIVEETGGFFLRRGRTSALREVERSFYLLFDGLVTHQGIRKISFAEKGISNIFKRKYLVSVLFLSPFLTPILDSLRRLSSTHLLKYQTVG